MTVREMLSRMDSYEIAEWKVLYDMDPWGELRDDHRSALQTAYFINSQPGRKTRIPVSDFLLKFDEPEDKQPVIVSEKTRSFANAFQSKLMNVQTKKQLRGTA